MLRSGMVESLLMKENLYASASQRLSQLRIRDSTPGIPTYLNVQIVLHEMLAQFTYIRQFSTQH